MKYDWQQILSVPSCHRWFRDRISGRVAVCDDSGKTPDTTDDGVIWLVEPCVIEREWGYDDGEWWGTVAIPGITESGRSVRIGGTNEGEAAALVEAGLATIQDHRTNY